MFCQLVAVVHCRVGIQIEAQRGAIATLVAEDGQVVGRTVAEVVRHCIRLAEAQRVIEGLDIHRQPRELLFDPEHAQVATHILEAVLLMPQGMLDHRGHLREQAMDRLLRIHLQTQRNHVGHQAGGLPVARIDAAGHRHCDHQILGTGAAVVIRGNQRDQHLRQAGAIVLAQRTQTHHLLRRKLPGATQQAGGQLIARPRQGGRRRQIGQLLHPVAAIALKTIGLAIVLLQFVQRQRTAVLRRFRLAIGGIGVIEHRHALHHDRCAIAIHHQMAHALHPHMVIFAKTEHRAMPQRPVLQIFRLADLFVHPMLGGVAWRGIFAEIEVRNRGRVLGADHLAGHTIVFDDAQPQRVELARELHACAQQQVRIEWAEHLQRFG
ncbi:hypothetical protein LMG31886_40580 [Xanthomonas hydrangeae]|nr:hypothetical protein LMG31885_19810 [Xanthomonas hydrangeae]CAD7733522.1 hypothetical protein LMG31885_19810 [Xanthomonas hydrangeae]CAD7746359.1 hypothetical protein LMG31886_40580 [Xanthomonas hydrangeae]CAD7746361.1 hypothetical protein LMG31886_40580 [Xanthomonas hydrangeae]